MTDPGLLTLTTIVLVFFSWLEMTLQDMFCTSIKSYIFSLLIIIVSNIAITGVAVGLVLGSVEALSVVMLLVASMGFPLASGVLKIPDISEKNNIQEQARAMIDKKGDNHA
jgi:hypothetical protein